MNKSWAKSADKAVGSASFWIYWIGVPVIVFMVAANGYEVIARYLFTRPSGFMHEILTYANMAVIFLLLGYAWRIGAHITVDIITSRLREWWQGRLYLSALVISFAVLVLLSVAVWSYEIKVIDTGRRADTSLEIPYWISNFPLCIGVTIFCLEMLISLVKEVRLFFKIGAR